MNLRPYLCELGYGVVGVEAAIPSTVPAFILKCESKPQLKDLDDQLITNCEQDSEKV